VRCDFTDSLLHSYFDDELSTLDALEFGRHVELCADCGTTLVNLDLLSGTLQLSQLYASAPASLLREVRHKLGSMTPPRAGAKPFLWQWVAAAAALLLVAIAAWRLSPELNNDNYETELAREIVDMHMRSLEVGYTTGITSHDERAVKEWVERKLKFALPVRDFADSGFALQSGRVDVVEGRSMAALVYVHEGRLIDVFIWPTGKPDSSPREGSQQNFQWVDWRKGKLEFCAVSDGEPTGLKQLYQLMDSSGS
jgi:anti-sigma factor RsiW